VVDASLCVITILTYVIIWLSLDNNHRFSHIWSFRVILFRCDCVYLFSLSKIFPTTSIIDFGLV